MARLRTLKREVDSAKPGWRPLPKAPPPVSGEYHFIKGQPRRRQKRATICGLNKDYNHDLKGLFKGAATRASVKPGSFQEFYQRSLAKGIEPARRPPRLASSRNRSTSSLLNVVATQ
jgi:hypothetical protein